MDTKHTPEPWSVEEAGNIAEPFQVYAETGGLVASIWTDEQKYQDSSDADDIASNNGGVYPSDPQYISEAEAEANAERIVACVNGCAGIADPSAVGDMKAAIEAAMEILRDSWGDEQLAAGDDQVYNVLDAALAKAEGR